MNRPCLGSYTIIYPHDSFPNQADAIIASLSKYDRRQAGMRVYMDGYLEYMLTDFGCEESGEDFYERYIFEMRDSFSVMQAPRYEVTNDPGGHVLGANRAAWICAMIMLDSFLHLTIAMNTKL